MSRKGWRPQLSAKRNHILIAGPEVSLCEQLRALLASAGYDVSVALSIDEGLGLARRGGIDVCLLASDQADSQWYVKFSDTEALKVFSGIRLILLLHGTVVDRARALDMGVDDVLSAPWDSAELLARVRAQLRTKCELDALERKMRIADEGREVAQTAFQALAVTEKMTRDAFSLGRTLKIGVFLLFALALMVAGIFLLYSRRADKETRRAYSMIAQLEQGVRTQEQLLSDARSVRQKLTQTTALELQNQTDELKQKLLRAQNSEVSGLRQQLNETTGRLHRIEAESAAAEGVIRSYAPSVCLLHVSVAFVDRTSRRSLRYGAINHNGEPLKDSDGKIVYTLEGRAPEVRADFFGTGFIVDDGKILTNHHVAQPWWNNDELADVTKQGLQSVIGSMTAYFPELARGIPVEALEISEEADLALLQGNLSELKRPILKLDSRKEAAVSGQPLLLLGYATGLSAILARTSQDVVEDIVRMSHGDPREVIEELARRKLIRPLVTQGHIGDVLTDRIVYDAQTTSGGSGGPLINREGRVIGVTFAVVKDFGGSNFGVPIRYAQTMLKH
jgi:DNA-binding response OmpR family regulator/S1-C subfamily serine protease